MHAISRGGRHFTQASALDLGDVWSLDRSECLPVAPNSQAGCGHEHDSPWSAHRKASGSASGRCPCVLVCLGGLARRACHREAPSPSSCQARP